MKRIIVILLFCLSFLACDKHELCDVVSQQAVSVMETGYVSAPQANYIFGVESSNILSVRTTPEYQRTFRTFRNNDCLFRNGKCINPRIFDFSIGEMISGWTGKLSLDRYIYSICFLRLERNSLIPKMSFLALIGQLPLGAQVSLLCFFKRKKLLFNILKTQVSYL